jgi:hypothetical protein
VDYPNPNPMNDLSLFGTCSWVFDASALVWLAKPFGALGQLSLVLVSREPKKSTGFGHGLRGKTLVILGMGRMQINKSVN